MRLFLMSKRKLLMVPLILESVYFEHDFAMQCSTGSVQDLLGGRVTAELTDRLSRRQSEMLWIHT